MELCISGLANDSIVDGPGLRYTIFTQGCPHHCPGCHNPETHAVNQGKKIDLDQIITDISNNPLLDGVTFSGGEPFLQSKACTCLAKLLHEKNLNIWVYTGYTFEELMQSKHTDWYAFLKQIDVLVDGHFEQQNRSLDLKYKGSTNQRIIDMKNSLKQGIPVVIG